MVGFAILAALSLWWMPRRVHKRGSFGSKWSAWTRSLYALVLGLEGWFLAVLIVMNDLAGGLSRQRPDSGSLDGSADQVGDLLGGGSPRLVGPIEKAGFAAAMGGALVDALARFGSTAGLLAFITTTVGGPPLGTWPSSSSTSHGIVRLEIGSP